MKLNNMIKLLPLLGVMAFSSATMAEESATVRVDVYNSCAKYESTCNIKELGIKIKCSGSFETNATYGSVCKDGDITITSTKYPIIGLSTYYYPLKKEGDNFTNVSQSYRQTTYQKNFDYRNEVKIIDGVDQPYLRYITLQKSIHNAIYGVASGLNEPLFESYRFVNLQLELFKNNIKKSDIGHTVRLQNALKEGMDLLSAKDKKTGEPLYTILDWRIQENSRLIIAFGSILDELLAEYDHVETIKSSISNMRMLVSQLKRSYGWNRGLSGNVSKASSTLLEVIRLEVQELGAIRMSLGESTEAFSNILKVTGSLKAKVDAAKSGDMRAQREIWQFLDVWNQNAWQSELSKLVNAGPDVKGLVTPKLKMLVQAMESIEELTEAGFLVPELD
jgi:hypothetical protein